MLRRKPSAIKPQNKAKSRALTPQKPRGFAVTDLCGLALRAGRRPTLQAVRAERIRRTRQARWA